MFDRDWVRVKWCCFGPFGLSPGNYNVTNAEGIGMFGAEMLDDAFETIKPGIAWTVIKFVANEKLLAQFS